MTELPKSFTSKGWNFQQLKRKDMVALYQKSKPGQDGQSIVSFEIVKIQIERAREFPKGVFRPQQEAYPYSEQWGIHAWTETTIERAVKLFKDKVSCYGVAPFNPVLPPKPYQSSQTT